MPSLHREIRRVWPLIAVEFAEQDGEHYPVVVSTVRSSKEQARLHRLYKSGKGFTSTIRSRCRTRCSATPGRKTC